MFDVTLSEERFDIPSGSPYFIDSELARQAAIDEGLDKLFIQNITAILLNTLGNSYVGNARVQAGMREDSSIYISISTKSRIFNFDRDDSGICTTYSLTLRDCDIEPGRTYIDGEEFFQAMANPLPVQPEDAAILAEMQSKVRVIPLCLFFTARQNTPKRG
jgi:hypothetical protein